MQLSFFKYHGTGNDFVLLDSREINYEARLGVQAVAWLCDRHMGIGADGLMLLKRSEQADFRMVYYNADGRPSTMCGNGGRCLVAFAHRLGHIGSEATFEAVDGFHQARIEGDQVHLQMIAPYDYRQLDEQNDWVHTGSPHYVRFVDVPVEQVAVHQLGSKIRYQSNFAAMGGTNVNFVQVLNPDTLSVRTYERGVEAETLSCGTGVVASAFCHKQRHPEAANEIAVQTPGGTLRVSFFAREEGLWLIGPAVSVFKGEIDLPDVA